VNYKQGDFFMKLALFLVLLTGSAFAEMKSIYSMKDLAAIKAACTDPASVGNQALPTDIKIFCTLVKTGWEESASGLKNLNTAVIVTSSATSSKPNAGAASETKTYSSEPFSYVCDKYSEYNAEASSVTDVTCEQVLEIADLNQFCKDAIEQDAAMNPGIFNVVFTGKVTDTCADNVAPGTFGDTPVQDPSQSPLSKRKEKR